MQIIFRHLPYRLTALIIPAILFGVCLSSARAQSNNAPLTSQELVRLVYQLPAHPEKRDEIVEEIRRRGIGFTLTDGLRSLVATKSGNDAVLRRTLEEAARRRLNPAASVLPSEAEGLELLAKAKTATMAAAQAMPDFIVQQRIARYVAYAGTNNWIPTDRLTVAVSYRANKGEAYKLLAVNGMPAGTEAKEESNSYEQAGGTSSTGEYVSILAELFSDESRASFKMVDTDLLRGRRTLVYEFEVQKPYSRQTIKAKGDERVVITGYRGRIWIDRETFRALRLEDISIDIPGDFPVTAASSLIDYDWVTINERQYLLPSRAEIILTVRPTGPPARGGPQKFQTRNVILFRGYQKFGTEVKIIEEGDEKDVPESKP